MVAVFLMLYRVSHGDQFDVHCAQYFVTLPLLLLYSFVGVSSLLRMCLRVSGLLLLVGMLFFASGRLYVVMVRVVLSLPLSLRICMVSLGGCFDSLEVLNGFLKQVVVSRRDIGIRKWTRWLPEDSGSRPYAWLRPDFVPPSPFLVVKDPQTQSSRILVEPRLIDAEFRKAWMPFFSRSGHPVVTPDQFLDFVGHLLPQEPYLELPRSSGRDLQELLGLKSLLLVGWMVGLGMKLKLFPLVLLFFWSWLRLLEFGFRVFWMPMLL